MPQLCLCSILMRYCYSHFRVEPQIVWPLFVGGLGDNFLLESQALHQMSSLNHNFVYVFFDLLVSVLF